jgi:ribonuclease P protein component
MLGITVSRRLGNSVIRNRLKRRIRECFRLGLRIKLPVDTAVVVVGRKGAGALEMRTIISELESAVAKLRHRLNNGHE